MPPFDDVRVRQAFDLALDRSGNANLSATVPVIPTIHLIPQRIPGYNPGLTDPAGRSGNDALSPDVAKAAELWKGYVDDKWGGDASKAPRVTFCIRWGSATAMARAAVYVREWQAAMPGLQVAPGDCEVHTQVRVANRMQLSDGVWIMDYPDPEDFLSLLMRTGAPYNQSQVSPPALTA